MEPRQLRMFLALVEDSSLASTAGSCGLSESTLAAQISSLEEELGCSLFRRKNGHFTLSAAGQVFMPRAKEILNSLNRAVGEMEAVLRKGPLLNIGHIGDWWMHRHEAVLTEFRHEQPDVQLNLVQGNADEVLAGLRDATFDLAVLEHVDVALRIEFKVRRMDVHGASVVLPHTHPLARRRRVALTELASDPWYLWSEQSHPGRAKGFLEACAEASFKPCVCGEVTSREMLFEQVLSAGGTGFVNDLACATVPSGLVLVPIRPAVVELPLFALWSDHSPKRALIESFTAKLLAEHPQG